MMLIPAFPLDNLLRKLQESLSVLSPELIPIHERLVNIRRQLVALAAKETALEVKRVAEKGDDYKGKVVATKEPEPERDADSKTPTRESTPKPSGSEYKDKDTIRVKAELKPLQEELRNIDSLSNLLHPTSRAPLRLFLCRKRVDGKFLGPGGMVPASQAICSSLLEECFDIVQEIRAKDESKNVASSLKPIYDRLSEIRKELEQLVRSRLSA